MKISSQSRYKQFANTKPLPISSSEFTLFHRPQHTVTHKCKRKSQRKSNIPSIIRRTDVFPNRTDEPLLGHSHHSAEDAEAEGHDGRETGREEVRGGIGGGIIAFDPFPEDKVLGE